MNAMQHAFAAKGVRPPALIYRAWRILKDNPGPMTAKRMTQLLGDKAERDVYSTLASLSNRGMVTKSKVMVRGPIGKVKTWKDRPTVAYGLTRPNAEYELLPVKKAQFRVVVTPLVASPLSVGSVTFADIEPVVTTSPVDDMTVATARDMYRAIRANFNTSTWD